MATSLTEPTSTRRRAPPLIVLQRASNLTTELGLPPKSTNLFQRLIRNPHAESDQAKERECAEMLCVVLQQAPKLRLHLLQAMAGLVNLDMKRLDDLVFEVGT